MNLHSIHNFITEEDRSSVLEWGYQNEAHVSIENSHIKHIHDALKGFSLICDLSHTPVTDYICRFQGDSTMIDQVPSVISAIGDSIAERLGLNTDHRFVQFIGMKAGGEVKAHYDACYPGYVTYKCNVQVSGSGVEKVYVDTSVIVPPVRGLYCFEASLYKHWIDPCSADASLLSYGFVVPYKDLGWSANSPRVRLSERIFQKFQPRT